MGCVDSNEGQSNRQLQYNSKIEGTRGTMEKQVVLTDDFLTHHLKYQIQLTKYVSTKKIRKRQILIHNSIASLKIGVGDKKLIYDELLQKSWMQRIMMQIFIDADTQFFYENRSIDNVRFKIAERYLFEVTQMKEMMDAALQIFSKKLNVMQLNLSDYILRSDSALYPALKFLKEKYPQVADNSNIKFPSVKEIKNDINLLDHFKSKSFSDPKFKNIQTLYSDLKFLIDKSVEEFQQFQIDMKAILGNDVLTDSKVKRTQKNGKFQYSASPVRRVLIKWAETLLQRIPQLILSKSFAEFINSKKNVYNNFYFKSTVQPSTHVLIIQYLLNLIQSSKYDIITLQKNPKFGFFIYDLVRCKTKRSTGEQIVDLLEKMIATSKTVSGKRFEVVRVKDRFKTPNRDLMVNFRYGEVLVGEAQLCIDTSDISEKTKKTNKFNHYIYELERGLFGPTLEIMMQYEDFIRTDISANLEAEGKVASRKSIKTSTKIKKVERKCSNGHYMIQCVGNHFTTTSSDQDYFCDYCLQIGAFRKPYHYCYQCTILFCLNCQSEYNKDNPKSFKLLCYRQDLIPKLNSQQQMLTQCQKNKSIIVLFYLSDQAASILYKDFLILMKAVDKMKKQSSIPFYIFDCNDNPGIDISERLGIKRFPTMIVFDRNGNAQTTIIGTSIYQLQGLIITQKNIAEGKPKYFQTICNFDNQKMHLTSIAQGQKINCYYCLGATKETNNQNIEDSSKIFKCSQGHSRCLSCTYNVKNEPCTFRDYSGQSYLSAARMTPSQIKCENGHLMQCLFENKSEDNKFKCLKCKNNFIFSDQKGMGTCKTCNTKVCSQCLYIEKKEKKNYSKYELICQTVQSTAEEAFPCFCGRLFKKAYNTRILEQQTKMENQQINNLNTNQSEIKWKCKLCQKQFTNGTLHYACFLCPLMLLECETRQNIQICLDCASLSHLNHRKFVQKIVEENSSLVCKQNHFMFKTTLIQSEQKLTYSCKFCQIVFYASTQRYHCKICKIDCCLNCSPKNLKNTNAPLCKNTCENKHKLFNIQKPQNLKFCENCRVIIENGYFTCQEGTCDYSLCYQCATKDLKKPMLQK